MILCIKTNKSNYVIADKQDKIRIKYGNLFNYRQQQRDDLQVVVDCMKISIERKFELYYNISEEIHKTNRRSGEPCAKKMN